MLLLPEKIYNMAELGIKTIILHREIARRDARVAEEARLESV